GGKRNVTTFRKSPYRYQFKFKVESGKWKSKFEVRLKVPRVRERHALPRAGARGSRCPILLDWQRAANASPPQTQQVRIFPPYVRLDDQQPPIVDGPMMRRASDWGSDPSRERPGRGHAVGGV